jgi:hypothetical protein
MSEAGTTEKKMVKETTEKKMVKETTEKKMVKKMVKEMVKETTEKKMEKKMVKETTVKKKEKKEKKEKMGVEEDNSLLQLRGYLCYRDPESLRQRQGAGGGFSRGGGPLYWRC